VAITPLTVAPARKDAISAKEEALLVDIVFSCQVCKTFIKRLIVAATLQGSKGNVTTVSIWRDTVGCVLLNCGIDRCPSLLVSLTLTFLFFLGAGAVGRMAKNINTIK
jgi:hypothetical protein